MPASDYPDDKSTIFSIAPFGGEEFKPGLYPGRFLIPPCKDDSTPARLSIGASEHIVQLGGKRPMRVTTPSFEVARSIVNDYLDGQLFSSPDAHPGILWLHGNVSLAEFFANHLEKYKLMQQVQRAWFVLVVKKTQDDWNKYHNSRVVSDHARFAVRALGMDIPEWMAVDQMGEKAVKCPACGSTVTSDIAWCPNCIQGGIKVIINEARAKTIKVLA